MFTGLLLFHRGPRSWVEMRLSMVRSHLECFDTIHMSLMSCSEMFQECVQYMM